VQLFEDKLAEDELLAASGIFIGPLRPCPPPEKYLGHLGRGPPLVFGNWYFKSELLAAG